MKKTVWAGLAAGLMVLAMAGAAGANLIVNGGFERVNEDSGQGAHSWQVYNQIPGWQTLSGSGIEVQNNVAGTSFEGSSHVELDSDDNSAMRQVIDTVSGGSYALTFAYSPRPGSGVGSNGIELLWNGEAIGTLFESGAGKSDTDWTQYSYVLVATGASSELGFRAIGTSDSLGGYLDDVKVNAVPEPVTMLLFGTGLAGLAGFARRKTRVRQAGVSV